MTRGQGFVAGVTGLMVGTTLWGVWTAPDFGVALIIAGAGFALTVVGAILFAVVLEERPDA